MSRATSEVAENFVLGGGGRALHLTRAQEDELNGRAASNDVAAMGELANYSYHKSPPDSTLAIFWHAKAIVESRGAAAESKSILSGSVLPHRVSVSESGGNSHLTKEQIFVVIDGVNLAGNRFSEFSSDMISEMTRVSAAELRASELVEIYQKLVGLNKDNSNSDSGHKIRAQIAGKMAEELGCDRRDFLTNRYEPYQFTFELRSRAAADVDLVASIKALGVEVGVDSVKEDGFLPCLIDLTPPRERRPGVVVGSPSAGVLDAAILALSRGSGGGGYG